MAQPTPALAKILAEMADEELARMSNVPWQSYADRIHERARASAGETYGCEPDDRYYDVGVTPSWASEPEGNIRLVVNVTAYLGPEWTDPVRAEREAIIPRP